MRKCLIGDGWGCRPIGLGGLWSSGGLGIITGLGIIGGLGGSIYSVTNFFQFPLCFSFNSSLDIISTSWP